MKSDRLLPLSILAAGVVIGAGLYFGLRAQAPQLAAPTASAAGVGGPTPANPPSNQALNAPVSAEPEPPVATATETAAPSADSQARALKEAQANLEALKRSVFLEKCWKPALAKEPQPAKAKYTFDVAFAPDGKETARGISEPRGESRADVGLCLNQTPSKLDLKHPPGQRLQLNLTLEFP